MTLLRTTLPELHAYFEEEEVDIVGFATSWLQHLLAGEMRIEDLMRLWGKSLSARLGALLCYAASCHFHAEAQTSRRLDVWKGFALVTDHPSPFPFRLRFFSFLFLSFRFADTYFAVPDPLDLHLYVCIAILTNCKDALEELDQSETKTMLFSLPPLDVDRVS